MKGVGEGGGYNNVKNSTKNKMWFLTNNTIILSQEFFKCSQGYPKYYSIDWSLSCKKTEILTWVLAGGISGILTGVFTELWTGVLTV